jgi:uncharacterized protein (DUF2147 family)
VEPWKYDNPSVFTSMVAPTVTEVLLFPGVQASIQKTGQQNQAVVKARVPCCSRMCLSLRARATFRKWGNQKGHETTAGARCGKKCAKKKVGPAQDSRAAISSPKCCDASVLLGISTSGGETTGPGCAQESLSVVAIARPFRIAAGG